MQKLFYPFLLTNTYSNFTENTTVVIHLYTKHSLLVVDERIKYFKNYLLIFKSSDLKVKGTFYVSMSVYHQAINRITPRFTCIKASPHCNTHLTLSVDVSPWLQNFNLSSFCCSGFSRIFLIHCPFPCKVFRIQDILAKVAEISSFMLLLQ